MSGMPHLAKLLFVLSVAIAAALLPRAATAESYQVLYRFAHDSGAGPISNLVADSSGNLYGTTLGGGGGSCKHGCGVIYRLAPDGTYSVLYDYQSRKNTYEPEQVLLDGSGNLYGLTPYGGAEGLGSIFELSSNGTYTILYSFGGLTTQGYYPVGLLHDRKGNLFGTTVRGGNADRGVIYELAPNGTETVLYSFCAETNCSDGSLPEAGLWQDKDGNLFGTAELGGLYNYGVVFRYSKDGTYSVLHSFGGTPDDGQKPLAKLIADSAGNLYGTTSLGGTSNNGVVFKIAPDGSETILHQFTGTDGYYPISDLLLNHHGELIGTAKYGNDTDGGNLFKVKTDGSGFKLIHSFDRLKKGGFWPTTGVIRVNGVLFGTASKGGLHKYCCGVIYRLSP